MGRLEPAAARWLMAALGLGILVFFLPWALFSPVIAGGGPLTRCAPDCPENVLQVGSAPDSGGGGRQGRDLPRPRPHRAGVLLVYVRRLRSRLAPAAAGADGGRGDVAAVPARPTSSSTSPSGSSSSTRRRSTRSRGGSSSPASCCRSASWSRCCRRSASRRRRCAACSSGSPRGPRPSMAGDGRGGARRCRAAARLLRSAAAAVPRGRRRGWTPPAAGAGRVWVPVERDGRPVAAMVIDETLAEDPELVQAAASATLLAVENGASRASCARRGRGSSRPATPSDGGSSATCTTARSSGSSRCAST